MTFSIEIEIIQWYLPVCWMRLMRKWPNIFQTISAWGCYKLFNETADIFVLLLIVLNPYHVNVPYLYPLKTSQKLWFSDVFSRYRHRTFESLFRMEADFFQSIGKNTILCVQNFWGKPTRACEIKRYNQ